MSGQLAGKVAIVTGAGSNIGRAVAKRFAREGARVGVADINEATANETVDQIAKSGGEAMAIQVEQLVETAVTRTGSDDFGGDTWREGLDVLVDSVTRESALNELGESVMIGSTVKVTVLGVRGSQVRVGIQAPIGNASRASGRRARAR